MTNQLMYTTKEVSEYWGDKMPIMAMEEAGELIQAISKLIRKDEKVYDDYEYADHILTPEGRNLVEEIGDVAISMSALLNRYDIPLNDVNDYIYEKLSKKY